MFKQFHYYIILYYITIYSTLHIFGSGHSTVLCHTDMRRSHPLPDQLPGEHTGLQATHLAQ